MQRWKKLKKEEGEEHIHKGEARERNGGPTNRNFYMIVGVMGIAHSSNQNSCMSDADSAAHAFGHSGVDVCFFSSNFQACKPQIRVIFGH